MHLLLIGHGYLGTAVAGLFRAAEWQVTATSLSGGDGTRPLDVSSAHAVADLAAAISPPDAIIHCAATNRGGADAYQRIYLDGSRHLLAAFPGVRLAFVSSSSVYAQTDGSLVTEDSPADPDRETGRILLETERLALACGGTVARLAGIYGPGRSVILTKFLAGQAVIEEDGRRILNQIHRDDAARALLRLVSLGDACRGGVFNVCDSEPISQLDCYRGLCGIFNRPLPPTAPRDLNRKRGWTHKRVSNAKLRATGWEPEFPSFLTAAQSVAATL